MNALNYRIAFLWNKQMVHKHLSPEEQKELSIAMRAHSAYYTKRAHLEAQLQLAWDTKDTEWEATLLDKLTSLSKEGMK